MALDYSTISHFAHSDFFCLIVILCRKIPPTEPERCKCETEMSTVSNTTDQSISETLSRKSRSRQQI